MHLFTECYILTHCRNTEGVLPCTIVTLSVLISVPTFFINSKSVIQSVSRYTNRSKANDSLV